MSAQGIYLGFRYVPADREHAVCGCYPECRIDCADREQCLDDMPEYQSNLDKAKRYAANVRKRRPEVRQWLQSVTKQ